MLYPYSSMHGTSLIQSHAGTIPETDQIYMQQRKFELASASVVGQGWAGLDPGSQPHAVSCGGIARVHCMMMNGG